MIDSIVAWLIVTLFTLWGMSWVLLACVNELEAKKRRSEYEWQKWERSFYEY